MHYNVTIFRANSQRHQRRSLLYALLVLLGSGFFFPAQAQYDQLTEKISLQLHHTTAQQLIEETDRQSKYAFLFAAEHLHRISIDHFESRQQPLGEVLTQLQKKYGLQFAIVDGNIAVKPGPSKIPSPTPQAPKKEPGRVTGKVIDEENGQSVIGATVKIGGKSAVTAIDGSFSIALPAGDYTAIISYVGYAAKEVTGITIKDGKSTELNITLKRQRGQLSAVVVKARAREESVASLYAKQKNNAAISDGISAEQIRVTPDNNAAQVLKRVSGLTVQEEKFVTIRGLSDRYNNVMLNGSTLPSTEPNRRNFAFDIIPSGLIDRIVVNKTATPDMSAEFAGGLVQVSTKDVPDKNHVTIGIGTGFNTNSIGKNMVATPRSKTDILGYDDGRRRWWRDTWQRFEYGEYLRNKRFDGVGEMNRRIPNNWGLYNYHYNPQTNIQLNAGCRFLLKNEGTIGITLGALYRHEETMDDEERRIYFGQNYDYTGNAWNYRTSLGGVLNVAYQHKGHKIVFRNLYNRLFNSETVVYTGTITGFGNGLGRNYTSLTLINDMRQHRLEGEHHLNKRGMKLDWSGDAIYIIRDQPDTRNSMGFREPGQPEGFYTYNMGELNGFLGVGSSIFNSLLTEKRYNWSANFTFPFSIAHHQQKLKAGYAGAYRDAYFESIGLLAVKDQGATFNPEYQQAVGLPEYELFSNRFMQPGLLFYYPASTRSTSGAPGEDYQGVQRLHTGYMMMDLSFLRKFRLIGGVRLEQNRMDMHTITYEPLYGNAVDSLIKYKKKHWLPSYNLVYNLLPKMNVRLAYSQTLSRPDFRERSPFIYYEFKERAEYKGARGLKDALITNWDIRYEYYISANELFSVSGFYKDFDSPVELVAAGTPGGGQAYYYFNLRSSTAHGAEVDFRKSFNFIRPASAFWKNLYVHGNFTWMKAKVKYHTQQMLDASNEVSGGVPLDVLPPDSRNRALQGLSPYIINAGIGYFGSPIGINLSYNRSAQRIVAGGLYPYEDQYENGRDVLDLQLSKRLLQNKLDIRLNISDLLQQPVIIYQNTMKNGIVPATTDTRENVNDDPKGNRYNASKDYVRFRSFRGSNLTLNVSYNF